MRDLKPPDNATEVFKTTWLEVVEEYPHAKRLFVELLTEALVRYRDASAKLDQFGTVQVDKAKRSAKVSPYFVVRSQAWDQIRRVLTDRTCDTQREREHVESLTTEAPRIRLIK